MIGRLFSFLKAMLQSIAICCVGRKRDNHAITANFSRNDVECGTRMPSSNAHLNEMTTQVSFSSVYLTQIMCDRDSYVFVHHLIC